MAKFFVKQDFDRAAFTHVEEIGKDPEKIGGKRRHYGDIFRHIKTDVMLYIADRRGVRELFRNGRKTPSAALRDGVAEWALNKETWRMLKRKGVALVAFHNMKTADLYFIAHKDIPTKSVGHHYTDSGGSDQYYINLDHFQFVPGIRDSLR